MTDYEKIVKKFGTPLYLFDIDELQSRLEYLHKSLNKDLDLCYAVKANTFIIKEANPYVARFEVCSPGEYEVCKKLNIPMEKLVISGVYKTPEVIDEMMENHPDMGIYTAESVTQFELLDELSKKHKRDIKVLLRLTSGNQFGMNEEEVDNIYKNREKYKHITLNGIEYFSGTQKHSTKRLTKEVEYLREFVDSLEEKYDIKIEEIEFGTGFPVYYFQSDEFDEVAFFKEFNEIIKTISEKYKITLEIGRSIASSCGSYLTTVVDKKVNQVGNFAILDGGMNHLVYYGQTMAMKHPHYELLPKRDEKNTEPWNLCGSLCTINDIIVKQLPVSNLEKGDVFIFKNTGAYCMSEGISLFLSRDLPKIVMKKGIKCEVVRETLPTHVLNTPNYKGE
jgi:diaminopimelate decarboxylase